MVQTIVFLRYWPRFVSACGRRYGKAFTIRAATVQSPRRRFGFARWYSTWARVLKEPVELAGYQLPAGVMVVPGIGLVHSSFEVYRDADRFDADRMVGATLSPATWFPFGGGKRRCLGATFAMVEMRVVLREILRRVESATTTAPGETQRVKHMIMVPRNGGRIRVRAFRHAPVSTTQPAG